MNRNYPTNKIPHPDLQDDEPTSTELENIDTIFQDMDDDDYPSEDY